MSVGQLLSAKEVAALLGVSRATFYRLSYFRTRKVRVASAVRYKLTDVIAFEHEHSRAA